jgi:hypothetical protein
LGDDPAGAAPPAGPQVLLGIALGLSPLVCSRRGVLLAGHADELAHAASVLGYDGVTAEDMRTRLAAVEHDRFVAALVPTPDAHKAMPPRSSWSLEIAAGGSDRPDPHDRLDRLDQCDGPDAPGQLAAAGELRLLVSPHRRNHTSPASSLVLADDTELWAAVLHHPAGAGPLPALGIDSLVRLNLQDHVACVGHPAVVVRSAGRLLTPPVTDGAPRTAWRRELVRTAGVAEVSLRLEDLFRADAVACVDPWGEVHAVVSIDDREYGERSLAKELHEHLRSCRPGTPSGTQS